MNRLQTLLGYLEEDPSDPFTRFALAQEYRKRGQTEEATRYFEELVRDAPDYVGTYYHLGKLYQESGRTSDAIRIYESGIVVARELRDFHALSELQDALLHAKGVGWDDD